MPDTSRHRILTISPYRPQAKLLKLLLEDLNIQDEVLTVTTHQFQGQEADVVIFDLVNDEPHWKVGLFNPKNDVQNRRLLNVAQRAPGAGSSWSATSITT